MVRVRPWLPMAVALVASAASLERLSMDDMVQKSTDIVRAHVVNSSESFRGRTIYTHYTLQVEERWKGNAVSQMDVAVPGGAVRNIRQTFPGAPVLNQGSEYVFFLWTSRSGLTLIIGLSQGLMNVNVDASGSTVLWRGAATEPMVDGSGNSVTDAPFSTSLPTFRTMMRGYGLVAK